MAREALPAGFQVLLEPAYAFVVRHAYTNTFCEHCLGKIRATASTSDMMRVSTRYMFSSWPFIIDFQFSFQMQIRASAPNASSCFAAQQSAYLRTRRSIASNAMHCAKRDGLHKSAMLKSTWSGCCCDWRREFFWIRTLARTIQHSHSQKDVPHFVTRGRWLVTSKTPRQIGCAS